MSTQTLFIIGIFVFAITVYGAVMVGGMLLERQTDREDAIPVPEERMIGTRLGDGQR